MNEIWSAVLLRVVSVSWTEKQSLDTTVIDDWRYFYLEMSPQNVMGRKMPCRFAVAGIGYECGIWQFSPLGCFCPVLPVALDGAGLAVLEFKGLCYPGPNPGAYLLAHHKAGPPISQFQPKPSYEKQNSLGLERWSLELPGTWMWFRFLICNCISQGVTLHWAKHSRRVRISVKLDEQDLGSAPPKFFLHKPVCLLCIFIDAVPLGQYSKGCSDSKLQKVARPAYIECLCASTCLAWNMLHELVILFW